MDKAKKIDGRATGEVVFWGSDPVDLLDPEKYLEKWIAGQGVPKRRVA
jgi:hypothetical protein